MADGHWPSPIHLPFLVQESVHNVAYKIYRKEYFHEDCINLMFTIPRFTKQEIKEAYSKMQDLTNQWHSDVEGGKISDGLDESSL